MSELYAPSPISFKGGSDFVFDGHLQSSDVKFEGESGLDLGDSAPSLAGGSTFIVKGLKIVEHPAGYYHVAKYVGERGKVPHDIIRDRQYVYELMRRMGTPVMIKKMLTEEDVLAGTAETSPNFNDIYGQSRNRDPIDHGIGYVSKEKSTNEWINTATSKIITANTSPGAGYIPAPKYRGYGPGFITYIIEPDAAEDYFKHTPEGVLIKVQTATAQAPWWPDINDNDLLVHVELDRGGYIVGTQERYQAKMTNPVSIRGARERRGRQEYSGDFGSRYVINQTFQMALLPRIHEAMKVEVDR